MNGIYSFYDKSRTKKESSKSLLWNVTFICNPEIIFEPNKRKPKERLQSLEKNARVREN